LRNIPIPAARPVTVLLSYAYRSAALETAIADFARTGGHSIIIDSGAFSAFTKGTPVELTDYLRWLGALPFTPAWYFTLDVIGDPDATRRNTAQMRAAGFDPVPIFTRGAPPDDLEAMYDAGAWLVGFGGIAVNKWGRAAYLRYVHRRHVRGRKVHWLGVGNMRLLAEHRPYSCDAVLYNYVPSVQRVIALYMGRGERAFLMHRNGRISTTSDTHRAYQALRAYGVDPGALDWNYRRMDCLGAQSQLRYVWDLSDQFGTTFAFPCIASSDIRRLSAAYTAECDYQRSIGRHAIPHRQDLQVQRIAPTRASP
jgi:hypothetical protein